jgi:hypothetical protein
VPLIERMGCLVDRALYHPLDEVLGGSHRMAAACGGGLHWVPRKMTLSLRSVRTPGYGTVSSEKRGEEKSDFTPLFWVQESTYAVPRSDPVKGVQWIDAQLSQPVIEPLVLRHSNTAPDIHEKHVGAGRRARSLMCGAEENRG